MARLNIKRIAESKGIGPGTLSDRTKMHITTINRLWKEPTEEVSNVDLGTLEKIAQVLEVPVRDLIVG